MEEKIKKWIEAGKDPRSAHWQGGLEAILNIFIPYIEGGKLTPVAPLEQDEVAVYNDALEVVDLSPNIYGAFLPPSVADKISPPASAVELKRIDPGNPSFKILVARPDEETRIACCEISPQAAKCGVEIFQAGALLGTYDFEDRAECLANLSKIMRAHMWEKGKWNSEDHKRYTVNWFERVVDLQKDSVTVQADFSFFHTPTLIKSNRIDALFLLIFEFFKKRINDPDDLFKGRLASIQAKADAAERTEQFAEMAERTVFQLLTVVKDLGLMDFESFSEKETRQFRQESERTVQRVARELASV